MSDDEQSHRESKKVPKKDNEDKSASQKRILMSITEDDLERLRLIVKRYKTNLDETRKRKKKGKDPEGPYKPRTKLPEFTIIGEFFQPVMAC